VQLLINFDSMRLQLNSDGSYSLEIFEDYIQHFSPPEYLNLALSRIRECWTEFGRDSPYVIRNTIFQCMSRKAVSYFLNDFQLTGVHIGPADAECHASKQFDDCAWSLLKVLVSYVPFWRIFG